MLRRCLSLSRRFQSDARGNIVIFTALALIPIVGAMGGAIDYIRTSSAKTTLQASLDAGVLAATHVARSQSTAAKGQLESKLRKVVEAHVEASGVTQNLNDFHLTVEANAGGVLASATARVPTTLLSVLHIGDLPIDAKSATESGSAPIEIVLALDTTDSMAANMVDLRQASQDLVDIITTNGTNLQVKVGLVPYVGAVNIGRGAMQEGWLDKAGTSRHHAQSIRDRVIAFYPPCESGDDENYTGGGNTKDGAFIAPSYLDHILTGFRALFGVTSAAAASPYAVIRDGCEMKNPKVISHWELFRTFPNARWKGCVEARPEPYDIDDTPPSTSTPDTQWVPYFWPDGTTGFTGPSGVSVAEGLNNYMEDGPFPSESSLAEEGFGRAYSVLKYDGKAAVISETGPNTIGPNRACPDPLVPLTTDFNLVRSRLASLSHYAHSGTNTADGVAWAMRVLSPGLPFTEGAAYGEIPKMIVLLSDGQNELLKDAGGEMTNIETENGGAFLSHYSAYGTLRYGRFGSEVFDDANSYLDERMVAACTYAKDAGIEIHVVAFGVDHPKALSGLKQCASNPGYVLEVARGGNLRAAFQAIAYKISPIRLTR